MKRLILVALLVAGCGGSTATTAVASSPLATPATERTPTAGPPEPAPTIATLPSDALSQMEIAFIGTPRQSEIRALLEEAFVIYDLEWTEDNLSRAGSVLVALRKDAEDAGREDITEMVILERMVVGGGLPGTRFPEAAALLATELRLE